MRDRLGIHKKLVEMLGTKNVYYQPPESLALKYPCIVYSLDNLDISRADDMPYRAQKAYKVTLIHNDSENEIFDKILFAENSRFETSYKADNLYHFVFTIFY